MARTDLVPVTPTQGGSQILNGLSEPLRAALQLADDDAVVDAIASSKALADEIQVALPILNTKARNPASEVGVKLVVARRFPLFPQAERTEGEWTEWWGDYVEACGDLPIASLEAGMTAWIRKPTSQFLPKPGELRQAALAAPFAEGRIVMLARKGVVAQRERAALASRMEFELEPMELKRFPKPPEDREFVRTAAAELRRDRDARIAADRPALPPGSFPPPPLDAVGMTREMRAHLGQEWIPPHAPRTADPVRDDGELEPHELAADLGAKIDTALEPSDADIVF